MLVPRQEPNLRDRTEETYGLEPFLQVGTQLFPESSWSLRGFPGACVAKSVAEVERRTVRTDNVCAVPAVRIHGRGVVGGVITAPDSRAE